MSDLPFLAPFGCLRKIHLVFSPGSQNLCPLGVSPLQRVAEGSFPWPSSGFWRALGTLNLSACFCSPGFVWMDRAWLCVINTGLYLPVSLLCLCYSSLSSASLRPFLIVLTSCLYAFGLGPKCRDFCGSLSITPVLNPVICCTISFGSYARGTMLG